MTKRTIVRVVGIASGADLSKAQQDAKRAGFDGVELALPAPFTVGGYDWLSSAADAGATVGVLAARCASCDAAAAAEAIDHLLDLAHRLQASCVNITLPPVELAPVPGQPPATAFARYQDAMNFAFAMLRRMRFRAESLGVAIALEAAAGGSLLSPLECRELVDSVNSWAVGICLDVNRLLSTGNPSDWLRTLGRRTHTLRVSTTGTASAAACLPDRAASALTSLAEAIGESAFEGSMILDGIDMKRGAIALAAWKQRIAN